MTRITRNQIARILRRKSTARVTTGMVAKIRMSTGMKPYLRKLTRTLALAAAPANSWICDSSSWSDVRIVEMTNSEICTAEFSSWTLLETPEFDDDAFIGECMDLFRLWTFSAEFHSPSDFLCLCSSLSSISSISLDDCECLLCAPPNDALLEECMDLFSFWTFSSSSLAARRILDGTRYVTVYYSRAFAEDYEDIDTELSAACSDLDCCCCDDASEECDCTECMENESEVRSNNGDGETCDCTKCSPRSFNDSDFCASYMQLTRFYAEDDDDEEVTVEPETSDHRLLSALLSTTHITRPDVPAGQSQSCPVLRMDSLASLFFKKNLSALPSPPAWMQKTEMDPPNTVASTVSLLSNWDALSASLSSSSLSNFFGIDPTGETSTVSLPSSFFASRAPLMSQQEWDEWLASLTASSSTVSIPSRFFESRTPLFTEAEWKAWLASLPSDEWNEWMVSSASTVSIPVGFFESGASIMTEAEWNEWLESLTLSSAASTTSSASTLFPDPSEVSSTSSSISTLFMDPSSAHSIFSIDPSGCSSSSSLCSSSASSLIEDRPCSECGFIHTELAEWETDADSGYESETDSSAPLLPAKPSSSTSSQRQTRAFSMLSECDRMLEKIFDLKKKLREMM